MPPEFKKILFLASAWWVFCSSGGIASTPESVKPNVLVVLTDDQGFGDAGFQGNPVLKTPHLDALARSGVRFTDFLASPTCSPSRAALLTGRHEFRSGVTHTIEGRNLLRLGVPTMADAFSRAGYRTAIFGKWHLGDPTPFHPLNRGFRHALVVGGGAAGQTPDFPGNTMFDPHLQENREWRPFRGHMTDVFADQALEWMVSSREPWFCYLAFNAPHEPLQIGREWETPYLDQGLPEHLAKFYGMITHLDAAMGRMLADLAARGILQRTIIVFLGDNGTALGGAPREGDFNGGLRGTKASAYQGGVRVPAIFSWPGHFAESRTVNTLASLCDVLPTLAEACNLDLGGFPESDGQSLLPILLSGTQPTDWPNRMVVSHVARWPSGTPAENLPFRNASIRDQHHSLVNGRELYDLSSDPGQEVDIANEHPEIRDRLRQAHLKWWHSVKDSAMEPQPFLVGLPDQGPVELTCMDWQPSRSTSQPLPVGLWEQTTLQAWLHGRNSQGVDGACGGWLLEVKSPGDYLIEICRMPPGGGDQALFSKGRALLSIADQSHAVDIPAGAKHVRMVVPLPAGRHFLEPVLEGQRSSGLPEGAYFCTTEKITPAIQ